ncbi:hypothetical protein ABT282_31085 [Streptomyces sp. NPDC000927]|uniref:hypothetical protein n=1 Tax=Streptomyces sp. NPDC000927 TaxID=3154371 RepID=UPI003321A22B
MFPGWMCLGGTEIINNERAAAYAATRGLILECDRCPELTEFLEHDPYQDPATDDAPWHDRTVAASEEFFGLLGGEITGMSEATFTRSPTPLTGDGSSIGPARRTHREITVTAAFLAASESGLSYGIGWLARALSGSGCGSSCAGMDMTVLAACPSDSPDPDAEIRYLYDVGISEGPTVTAREWVDGVLWGTVTFTLIVGKPGVFGPALGGLGQWRFLTDGRSEKADPDQVYEECLPTLPCATDPTCPPPILPPSPPVPVSPCYTKGVAAFRVARLQVIEEEYPAWTTLVPLIEVQSGAGTLRRLLIRFWANPANLPCEDGLDPCDACGDINVPFIPANARLTIDARTRRSMIECADQDGLISTTYPSLMGPRGGAFSYPEFPCPGGLCVEVWALTDGMGVGASARVSLVPRMDAI